MDNAMAFSNSDCDSTTAITPRLRIGTRSREIEVQRRFREEAVRLEALGRYYQHPQVRVPEQDILLEGRPCDDELYVVFFASISFKKCVC